MELNRSQLLVHDNATLAQFHANHNIPDNVLIKRPGPNEDVELVEGESNHIPIQTWLIHQVGLKFPFSPLLKEVMALRRLTFMQVSVNFIRTVLAMDVLMRREGPYLLLGICYTYIA